MIEYLPYIGAFMGVIIVQFSALWFKLGRVEGKIESLILGRDRENGD